MLKNWLVKTKQIKKKDSGFINHCAYLVDNARACHSATKIKVLNNAAKNIVDEFQSRKKYRSENKFKGKGACNLATSFVISLPSDIQQPTIKEWRLIALYAIKQLSFNLDIDYKKLKSLSHIVLHDESASFDKHSHVHILVSNIVNNDVIKKLTQYSSTYCVKSSVNHSVKKLLNVDNYEYKPKNSKVKNLSLWMARVKKIKSLENKIKSLQDKLHQFRQHAPAWAKTFLADMFTLAERKAKIVAIDIDAIEAIAPTLAKRLDSTIDKIEKLNDIAPKRTRVLRKRRRRKPR